MKKSVKIIFIFVVCALLIGSYFFTKSNKKEKENIYNITVLVFNKEAKEVYNEKIKTKETNLLKALKGIDNLELTTKTGDYGEYITTINKLIEEDNYYWNYYVNDEYATVGVSNYEIKNKDVFTFKLEKFE